MFGQAFGKSELDYFLSWALVVASPPERSVVQMCGWDAVLASIARGDLYQGEPVNLLARMWRLFEAEAVGDLVLEGADELILDRWGGDCIISPGDIVAATERYWCFMLTWVCFVRLCALDEQQRAKLVGLGRSLDSAIEGDPFEIFDVPRELLARAGM